MIHQQVEDSTQRMKRELELASLHRDKAERHAKLDDLRKDYELKLQILAEIERENQIRQQYLQQVK